MSGETRKCARCGHLRFEHFDNRKETYGPTACMVGRGRGAKWAKRPPCDCPGFVDAKAKEVADERLSLQ